MPQARSATTDALPLAICPVFRRSDLLGAKLHIVSLARFCSRGTCRIFCLTGFLRSSGCILRYIGSFPGSPFGMWGLRQPQDTVEATPMNLGLRLTAFWQRFQGSCFRRWLRRRVLCFGRMGLSLRRPTLWEWRGLWAVAGWVRAIPRRIAELWPVLVWPRRCGIFDDTATNPDFSPRSWSARCCWAGREGKPRNPMLGIGQAA